MKKIIKISLLLVITFFIGCSSDGGGSPDFSSITLTTKTPQLINNGLSISCGGNASTSITSYTYGICYSASPNPTIINNVQYTSESTSGEFINTIDVIELGTTIYLKAFIQNNVSSEIKYGNEVSINVPLTITTGIVKGISTNGFNLDITIGSNLSSNLERGVCFGTGQNPIIGDVGVYVVQSNSNGAGTFNISTEDYSHVLPNTNYNLRSYVKMGNLYYYGNQVSFRTTGYIGGSGGYIFYDKGETTNGWRYLEAYGSYLTYTITQPYFKWSCNNNFISGISNEIGTGLENSHLIKNVCNFSDVAAAVALDKTYNNQNSGSWFVPSIEELKQLYKLKVAGVFNFSGVGSLLSSSQSSATECFAISVNGSNPGIPSIDIKTSASYNAWPVRRF